MSAWILAVAACAAFGFGYLQWRFSRPITRAINWLNAGWFRYSDEGTRLVGVGFMAMGVVVALVTLLVLIRGH